MTMRHTVLSTFVVIAVSCGGGDSTSTQSATPSASREWYSGGTLHARTVQEWRAATYENRLATSADFVMTLGRCRSLPPDLRQRAEAFERCITEAAEGGATDDRPVSETGATCGVLLGY